MSNPAFLRHTDNLLRQVTPVPDFVDPVYPVANIIALPVSKPYRSTAGVTSIKILFDFTTAVTIDMVAVVAHNLTSSATITWRGGTTTDPDGVEFSTTLQANSPAWQDIQTTTFQFWSLIIDDTTNPDVFISIGYILAGVQTVFPMIFQEGWRVGRYTNIRELESEAGSPLVGAKISQGRTLGLEFIGLSTAEATAMDNFLVTLDRVGNPTLVAPGQDAVLAIFGRLEEDYEFAYMTGHAETALLFKEDPVPQLLAGLAPVSEATGLWDTKQWDTSQWGGQV